MFYRPHRIAIYSHKGKHLQDKPHLSVKPFPFAVPAQPICPPGLGEQMVQAEKAPSWGYYNTSYYREASDDFLFSH